MNTDYALLNDTLKSFIQAEPHWLPTLSNASALLFSMMEDINWAGFYLMDDYLNPETAKYELILGPFQGKVACIRIKIGKGVCGTAVADDEPKLVLNVHEFPGHIACDSASNSEIVIPIHHNGNIIGVLDIDSPSLGRFSDDDLVHLTEFVQIIEDEMLFC